MKRTTSLALVLPLFMVFFLGSPASGINLNKVDSQRQNLRTPRTAAAAAPRLYSGRGRSRSRDNSFSTPSGSPRIIPDDYSQGTEGANAQSTHWQLGIYPKDADYGVTILRTIPGSAAERAGLEKGDTIVTVQGFQVGYVNGTLYDMGYEFDRRADAKGWVTALVQNNRDGRLINLPIQLTTNQAQISGTITYRERISLPQDSLVTVELRETLRPGAPPITIARQSFRPDRQVVPISFTLPYDSTEIDRRRTYGLVAHVTSGNRMLLDTRQEYPAFAGGATNAVRLLVESTAAAPRGGGPTLRRDDQMGKITRWFQDYLRREPRSSELYVWRQHLDRGGSYQDAQTQILSTPEFYYQANANDSQFIQRMHQLVTGQQASSQQVNHWLGRLQAHNRLRSEVAREFLASYRNTSR